MQSLKKEKLPKVKKPKLNKEALIENISKEGIHITINLSPVIGYQHNARKEDVNSEILKIMRKEK